MADVSRCGRCGKVFKLEDDAPYNSLCGKCRVPHQLLQRSGPGDLWRCAHCGQQGAEAALRATDCTHVYAPCESCGLAPFCAPDCSLVAAALGQPGVYVVGTIPPGGKN